MLGNSTSLPLVDSVSWPVIQVLGDRSQNHLRECRRSNRDGDGGLGFRLPRANGQVMTRDDLQTQLRDLSIQHEKEERELGEAACPGVISTCLMCVLE
jgi:hypothetical protein